MHSVISSSPLQALRHSRGFLLETPAEVANLGTIKNAALWVPSRQQSFQVWKTAPQCGFEKSEMTDHLRKLGKPPLPIGYFRIEQIQMMAPVRFTVQIFVGRRSDRNRSSRKYVLNSAA